MGSNGKLAATHVILFALVGAAILLLDLTGIGCAFRTLTGIPCPTCGTTRSLLSLLRFDLGSYVRYNPMSVPVVSAVLLVTHSGRLPKGVSRWVPAYAVLVGVLTFGVYLYRLRFGLIP